MVLQVVQLFLEDAGGDPHGVRADAVAGEIARRARDRIGGVILSACDGDSCGPPFTNVAWTVVAQSGQLEESEAVAFTERFYSELCRMPVIGTAAALAAIPGRTLIFPEDRRFLVNMRGEP